MFASLCLSDEQVHEMRISRFCRWSLLVALLSFALFPAARRQGLQAAFSVPTAEVTAAAFSPDGKWLLTGYKSTAGIPGIAALNLTLWEVSTGKEVRSWCGHDDHVTFVAYLPDGKRAVTVALNREIKLWDMPDCRETKAYKLENVIGFPALSPDGKLLLTYGPTLWDLESGKRVRDLERPWKGLGFAFSPDGKLAVSGGRTDVGEYDSAVWDVASGRQIRRFDSHVGTRMTPFSPDGKRLLGLKNNGLGPAGTMYRMVLIGVEDGKIRPATEEEETHGNTAYFNGSGRYLLTAGIDGKGPMSKRVLTLWELATRKRVWTVENDGAVFALTSDRTLAFTAWGNRKGGESGLTMRLWDIKEGKLVRPLEVAFYDLTRPDKKE